MLLLLFGVEVYSQTPSVVYLGNRNIKVGIRPGIGGRIVFFGLTDRGNILKQDTVLWNEPEAAKPGPETVNSYKPYHGNQVWLSPMGQWWQNQNIYPSKKGDRWPPDPYLIYSSNKIISRSNSAMVWQSPESPLSGIQLTQQIEIIGTASLSYRVKATNVRDTALSWGLWINTPVEGKARCFVKVSSVNSVKIKDKEKLLHMMPYSVVDSFFSFDPYQIEVKEAKIYSKACITPLMHLIAVFHKNQLMIIETIGVESEKIHPDQNEIEIFNQIAPDPVEDLLELEFHSAYKTIAPGESIAMEQVWTLFPYDGSEKRDDQLKFLLSKLSCL